VKNQGQETIVLNNLIKQFYKEPFLPNAAINSIEYKNFEKSNEITRNYTVYII